MRFSGKYIKWMLQCGTMILLCFITLVISGFSQETVRKYTVKNGRMYIELSRNLPDAQIDRFIQDFDLQELGLKTFIRKNQRDSLVNSGWKIETNDKNIIVISKPLLALEDVKNPGDRIKMMEKSRSFAEMFPSVNNGIVMGYNSFRNKAPFAVKDSVVTFYLRGNTNARRVMLAGSFNEWSPERLSMTKTDSGWMALVKLGPGKWWYKFIVDGNWIIDPDNNLRENDGEGNINSVYYRPSVNFVLNGYTNARRVYLAGSFNNWRQRDLVMVRTATGWRLPLYLAQGTHTYKFLVDGKWVSDEGNSSRLPDGHGGYNSVLRIGLPHEFKLNGYTTARTVALAGSFNGWRYDELYMNKTANGWELPHVLGPGNYEYKFVVDGKWISDPANPLTADNKMGNSFLIIQPNYTFRLRGNASAKSVYLAGDFNSWSPNSFAMRKEGNDWVFSVNLSIGKHRYKFIVDGKWILDPENKLWEQNEYGTGNSIIWIAE